MKIKNIKVSTKLPTQIKIAITNIISSGGYPIKNKFDENSIDVNCIWFNKDKEGCKGTTSILRFEPTCKNPDSCKNKIMGNACSRYKNFSEYKSFCTFTNFDIKG